MAGGGEQKSLEQTPTWAVAIVCTVFVLASLCVERGLKYLGRFLKRTKQKQLLHTLIEIKDELMLLGFISLSLTVFQSKIASMCMPERLNKIMLPCKYEGTSVDSPAAAGHRRLLASGGTITCPAGKVQVISIDGLHQLHIFIFVMAIVHVIYSAITVLVGLWQVHRWKRWETQSQTDQKKCMHKALAPSHFTDKILQRRMSRGTWLQKSRGCLIIYKYLYSFFKQFGKPIYKSDYLCVRYGFIKHHELDGNFDFHSYIKRSMESDFKQKYGAFIWIAATDVITFLGLIGMTCVGFGSGYLWGFVCIYLLVDIHGWYSYFWLAFVPTIMILFVGAKLQLIITSLVLEVRAEAEALQSEPDCKPGKPGMTCPAITPRDSLFWFNYPRLLLFLVHFILFQNAFELAFFFWTVFTYGYDSCLVGTTWMVIVRILVGFFVQILCSASTLPLYALVSQLGSTMKLTIFKSESTGVALKGWAKSAKKKHRDPNHVHEPLTPTDSSHDGHHDHHAHLGVLGLNKAIDEHGHPVDIPLGTKLHTDHGHEHDHHNVQHNGHKYVKTNGHHLPPHPHSHHLQFQDGSHTVEITEPPAAAVNEPNLRRPLEGEDSKP